MAVIDLLLGATPESAVLFKALTPGTQPDSRDAFTFQYWPATLQDSYEPNYATKQSPGASHALYQWVGGGERTISFEAIFTAEINQTRELQGTVVKASRDASELLPSGRYTVDVAAALARIRSWMLPTYAKGGKKGLTEAPPRLWLYLPNMGLGGAKDVITVILKSAPITIEACFPNGEPRVATVQMTFAETVQSPGSDGKGPAINFIDRTSFEKKATDYYYQGASSRPASGGIST